MYNRLKSRSASLEEDPYSPDVEFADHFTKDAVVEGFLYGNEQQNADFQRFRRIASAQEMEDFDAFYDTSDEVGEFSLASPDSGIHDLDAEARAKADEDKHRELAKIEEEINTLRLVLSAKIRQLQELKRQLGITVWKEFKDDMEQGIKNIQETTAYHKASQTLKSASEKTSGALGTIGASVSKKFEEVKQSSTFKAVEEKVTSAYSNVKTKMSGNYVSLSEANGQPFTETSSESSTGKS